MSLSHTQVAAFTADTLKGAQIPNSTLIPVLTEGSVDSLAWLRSRYFGAFVRPVHQSITS